MHLKLIYQKRSTIMKLEESTFTSSTHITWGKIIVSDTTGSISGKPVTACYIITNFSFTMPQFATLTIKWSKRYLISACVSIFLVCASVQVNVLKF